MTHANTVQRTSCIRFPKNDPFAIIRNCLRVICDENGCAAAILNNLISWHDSKLSYLPQAKQKNRVAEMHGDEGTQDTSLLVYLTEQDLIDAGIREWKKDSIRKAIKILVEKGYASIHSNPNPRYSFDKTRYFLLHPEPVQKALDEFEYGEPEPDEPKTDDRRSEKQYREVGEAKTLDTGEFEADQLGQEAENQQSKAEIRSRQSGNQSSQSENELYTKIHSLDPCLDPSPPFNPPNGENGEGGASQPDQESEPEQPAIIPPLAAIPDQQESGTQPEGSIPDKYSAAADFVFEEKFAPDAKWWPVHEAPWRKDLINFKDSMIQAFLTVHPRNSSDWYWLENGSPNVWQVESKLQKLEGGARMLTLDGTSLDARAKLLKLWEIAQQIENGELQVASTGQASKQLLPVDEYERIKQQAIAQSEQRLQETEALVNQAKPIKPAAELPAASQLDPIQQARIARTQAATVDRSRATLRKRIAI
jgi:hypothetical protein